MNHTPKVGIKQKIQSAISRKEIETLLATVRNYSHAHPSTVRKCEREAEKRFAQLNAEKP